MIRTNSDGGARGNPGPGAIGVVIRKDGKIVKEYKSAIGKTTNNVAEYKAVIKALELASKFGQEITCYLDSELVVKQLRGEYQVKNAKLKSLYNKAKKLERHFYKTHYKQLMRLWIKNKIASFSLIEYLKD
jgi:ribonuclease HI